MNVKDLMSNAKNLTDYEFEQKLNKLVRENHRYRNLDESNRKIVLDMMKKHKSNLRKGIGIGYSQRQREMYKLSQQQEKLGISKEDLKDIKEIFNQFK